MPWQRSRWPTRCREQTDLPPPVMERFRQGGLLFDGGMGSMLIGKGLATGWLPEEWNVSRRDDVLDVHVDYLNAGARVIETNTFGGTPARLNKHGFAERVAEFNAAGIAIARAAVDGIVSGGEDTSFVAFSMGPGGDMFPPVGKAEEGRVRDEFLAQLAGASGEHGPDMVLVETMLDVREAVIALEAVRSVLDIPIAVSMTYDRNPRGFYTIMGNEAIATTAVLEDAGVDVIAANCSISSGDMLDLARSLRESTELPLLCQPNAGKPGVRDGRPVYYQTAEEFAVDVAGMFSLGVNAVGGCCGTDPEFIRLAAAAMQA